MEEQGRAFVLSVTVLFVYLKFPSKASDRFNEIGPTPRAPLSYGKSFVKRTKSRIQSKVVFRSKKGQPLEAIISLEWFVGSVRTMPCRTFSRSISFVFRKRYHVWIRRPCQVCVFGAVREATAEASRVLRGRCFVTFDLSWTTSRHGVVVARRFSTFSPRRLNELLPLVFEFLSLAFQRFLTSRLPCSPFKQFFLVADLPRRLDAELKRAKMCARSTAWLERLFVGKRFVVNE